MRTCIWEWPQHFVEKSAWLLAPASLPPRNSAPGTRWIGHWVGLRACKDTEDRRKILLSPRCKPRPSSQYTVNIPTESSQLLHWRSDIKEIVLSFSVKHNGSFQCWEEPTTALHSQKMNPVQSSSTSPMPLRQIWMWEQFVSMLKQNGINDQSISVLHQLRPL
jgi:hypothetical protein